MVLHGSKVVRSTSFPPDFTEHICSHDVNLSIFVEPPRLEGFLTLHV